MKPSYLDFKWSVSGITRDNSASNLWGLDVKMYCFNLADYRETTSYNWFFHGFKERNVDRINKIRYIANYNAAYERIKGTRSIENELYLPKLEAGDFIVCENLYDFYEKIGWDRKKQKYLTKENIIVK